MFFKKILVHQDFHSSTSQTLKRGFELAQQLGAELSVVSVMPKISEETSCFVTGYSSSEIEKMFRHEHENTLKEIVSPFQDQGVTINTEVLEGEVYLELIREVIRNGHDLLIKERTGSGVGSTSSQDMRLFRQCPSAVWVLPEDDEKVYRKVLAAIDPDVETEEGEQLNQRIIEAASLLSTFVGAELHLISSWQLFGDSFLRRRLPADEIESWESEARERAEKAIEPYVASRANSLRRENVHLIKGEAMHVLPLFIEEAGIDVVVMGTIVRTGLKGFLIGNTAEQVLSSISHSVLAVKPKGFISPIKVE